MPCNRQASGLSERQLKFPAIDWLTRDGLSTALPWVGVCAVACKKANRRNGSLSVSVDPTLVVRTPEPSQERRTHG